MTFRIAHRVGLLGALILLATQTGCLVGQPHGSGQRMRITEPASKREYFIYLPEPYQAASAEQRKARRWPLVVTFHGMKPFDHADWQLHEWEAEADRYGYIVCAPRLNAPDVLAEFPLRRVHPAFKGDEDATVAILNHVFSTTEADRTNVLATGFSSGGYMAHYMLNRHPELFTCLAARQANFASSVLEPSMTSRSRNTPVLVMYTQNDMGICKEESQAAVQWYEKYGYGNIGWVKLKDLGHVRTPDIAADFFGRVANVRPSRSASVLANRQALAGNSKGLAFLGGANASPPVAVAGPKPAAAAEGDSPVAAPPTRGPGAAPPVTAKPPPQSPRIAANQAVERGPAVSPREAAARDANTRVVGADTRPPRGGKAPATSAGREPIARAPNRDYAQRSLYDEAGGAPINASSNPPNNNNYASTAAPRASSRPLASNTNPRTPPTARPPRQPAPTGRQTAQPRQPAPRPPTPTREFRAESPETSQSLAIRVSSAIGIEPLHLGFWADCPRDWHRAANFRWTLNGQPIASGINGQKTIDRSGDHTLGLLVTTPDGKQYQTTRRVRVLPPAPAAYNNARPTTRG